MAGNMGLALGEKLGMLILENVVLNSKRDRVLNKVQLVKNRPIPSASQEVYGVASLRTHMSKTFQAEIPALLCLE